MKNNKYIVIFFVLQFLTFIVASTFSVFLSRILECILILYELFYIVNIYKGKERKKIVIYLFCLVISFLIYLLFYNDAGNIISLLNIAITPIFIFTYYGDRKFSKAKVLLLSRFLPVISVVLSLLFPSFNFLYLTVLTYPLLFVNREYYLKDYLLILVVTLLGFLTKTSIVIYPMVICLSFLSVYFIFKKNSRKASSSLFILMLGIVLMTFMKITGFYTLDSEVFASEHFVLKAFKVAVTIVPLLSILLRTLLNFKSHKFKINYEMFLIILSVLGFVFLTLYTRFDYPVLIIVITSLLLVVFNKYYENYIKRLNGKKVTILALHLGYGGIEKFISSLTKILDGYEVEIISTYKIYESPAFDYNNAKITYLINKGPNKREFSKAVDEFNIFKIIFESIKGMFIILDKKAYNIDSIMNIDSKYVITTRDFHNSYVGNYLNKNYIKIASEHNHRPDDKAYIRKVAKSVKRFNYFVLVSPELRDLYSGKVNKKVKCVFIPNVIDELSTKKAKFGTHNIINVGRINALKGQKDLIDVIALIAKKYDDVCLTLVGDGQIREELEEYAKKKKLKKNVVFTGFLDSKEIEKLSLKQSVFATCSYSESFGICILEAQNYSLPVVAFDTANGVKYLLKNGSGILVENRDKEVMAEEIEKLFEDKKYFKNYSEASYKNAKEYDLDSIRPLWDKIIK